MAKDNKKYNDNRYVKKWSLAKRAVDLLGGKCKDCGETHVAALSFHHSNPAEKEYDVARLIQNRDWENVEKEIKKCELLCENCHRKRHFDQERYDHYFNRICNQAAGIKCEKQVVIKKWRGSETQCLIELYSEGTPVWQIAKQMDREEATIRRRINGLVQDSVIQQREKISRRAPISKRITDEMRSLVWNLDDQFVSGRKISYQTGISERIVYKLLKEKKNGQQELVFDSQPNHQEGSC